MLETNASRREEERGRNLFALHVVDLVPVIVRCCYARVVAFVSRYWMNIICGVVIVFR